MNYFITTISGIVFGYVWLMIAQIGMASSQIEFSNEEGGQWVKVSTILLLLLVPVISGLMSLLNKSQYQTLRNSLSIGALAGLLVWGLFLFAFHTYDPTVLTSHRSLSDLMLYMAGVPIGAFMGWIKCRTIWQRDAQ